MSSKHFLDVDESIIEKNLLIQSNEEQEFEQFVNGFLQPDSGKIVKPAPGICIKVFRTDDKSKVFLNICHHIDIPPPEDITQEELIEVLSSKDPERYCVPLSIGTEHEEIDKSGVIAKAYDVAVNTNFFIKCENDQLFMTFIISASLEGIAEKFKLKISTENPIILKNRKCIGCLQHHRIQNRPPRPSLLKKKPKIQELNLTEFPSELEKYVKPDYRIYVQPENNPKTLIVDIWLPEVISSQEITLKCGEDCIILTTKKQTNYELDIYFPYNVDYLKANVTFNTLTKILSFVSIITAIN